jgi:hypothetical protein
MGGHAGENVRVADEVRAARVTEAGSAGCGVARFRGKQASACGHRQQRRRQRDRETTWSRRRHGGARDIERRAPLSVPGPASSRRGRLDRDCKAQAEQIRSIAVVRAGDRLGVVPNPIMLDIDVAPCACIWACNPTYLVTIRVLRVGLDASGPLRRS